MTSFKANTMYGQYLGNKGVALTFNVRCQSNGSLPGDTYKIPFTFVV